MIINGLGAEWLPVSSGVPQGSILGPLLLIIYLNYLSQIPLSSLISLYADDTSVPKLSHHQPTKVYSRKTLMKYATGVKTQISPSISQGLMHIIHFSRNMLPHTTIMNGVLLSTQNRCRDLGVMFTSDLSWTEHYNTISCKAFQNLGLIHRTFSQYAPSSVKKLLYLTLLRSQLMYCSPIWRPRLIKDILLLERVQRKSSNTQ